MILWVYFYFSLCNVGCCCFVLWWEATTKKLYTCLTLCSSSVSVHSDLLSNRPMSPCLPTRLCIPAPLLAPCCPWHSVPHRHLSSLVHACLPVPAPSPQSSLTDWGFFFFFFRVGGFSWPFMICLYPSDWFTLTMTQSSHKFWLIADTIQASLFYSYLLNYTFSLYLNLTVLPFFPKLLLTYLSPPPPPPTEQWQRDTAALCRPVRPLSGGAAAAGGTHWSHHEE